MTGAQKAWLDANPDYRPIGTGGGFSLYQKRGTLHPDGRFEPVTRESPRTKDGGGAFGVGILAVRDPQRPGDIRRV